MSDIANIAHQPSAQINTALADKAYRQIGILARIIDFFQGGVAYEKIQGLLTQAMDTTNPEKSLASFNELRTLAKLENQEKFVVKLTLNDDDTLSYAFHIGEEVVVKKGSISSESSAFPDYFYAAFPEDGCLIDALDKVCGELKLKVDLAILPQLLMKCNQQADPLTPDTNAANKFATLAEQFPAVFFNIKIDGKAHYELAVGANMHVKQTTIYSADFSSSLQTTDPQAFTTLWVTRIKMGIIHDLHEFKDNFTEERLVQGNIQTMVDEPKAQEALKRLLDDPSYSKANFIAVKSHPTDDSKMIAVFKGDKELAFSARSSSSAFELRGKVLEGRLQESKYHTLRDLVSAGGQTESDSGFVYCLAASKGHLWTDPPEDMSLKEIEQINQQLATVTVGNTTLGKMWGIPVAPTSELLPADLIEHRA